MKLPALFGSAALAAAAAATLAVACQRPGSDGPGIALITVEGWRADAVGFLGGPPRLTPNLDRLAEDADWAGAAIAPAGASAPALASVLTGLGPWRHRVLTRFDALPSDAITLAEALAKRGYRTRAFRGQTDVPATGGFAQGMGAWKALHQGEEARAALADLGPGEFVWVHLAVASEDYVRRNPYVPRLPPELLPSVGSLPGRLSRGRAMRRNSPARPLGEERLREVRALYLTEVARVDEILGGFLEGWERSGGSRVAALAVVATRGEELGENGWVGDGRSLNRAAIEVPLVLRLPAAAGRKPVSGGGADGRRPERAGTHRLWATLVELAGGEVPAGVEAGLFAPAPSGILSELYGEAGRNEFSSVDAEGQYLRALRFAPFKVRRSGPTPRVARLERRWRQERVFRQTLPWSGAGSATRVERGFRPWPQVGGMGAWLVGAAADLDRRETATRARWLLFAGPEVTPARRAVLY